MLSFPQSYSCLCPFCSFCIFPPAFGTLECCSLFGGGGIVCFLMKIKRCCLYFMWSSFASDKSQSNKCMMNKVPKKPAAAVLVTLGAAAGRDVDGNPQTFLRGWMGRAPPASPCVFPLIFVSPLCLSSSFLHAFVTFSQIVKPMFIFKVNGFL